MAAQHSVKLLMSIESALQSSKELALAFDKDVNGLEFPATDRARLAAALLDQAHEHHKAVGLLISSGFIGSAFSLVRALFETTIRGLWLFRCASDAEIEHFSTDPGDLRIGPMIESVEALYGSKGGILTRVKKQYWAGLCSYAHGGYLQAVRRVTPEHIAPSYGADEQLEVLSFADFCFFLAAVEALNLAGKPDLATKWSNMYPFGASRE